MTADRHRERQRGIREWLAQNGIDALVSSHMPNIRYVTGFTGSAALVVVGPQSTVLLTDFRYAVQAPREVGGAAAVLVEQGNVWGRLATQVADYDTVGFEAESLTVRDAGRLDRAAAGRTVPTHGVVERLRTVKDPAEVEAIREAARLAEEALDEVAGSVRVGDTELAIAGRLESALRCRGSEWHPFPTIVASGARSALPHAQTSGRQVVRGDLLLVDFGARVDGYCADLTRTFVVGAPPDERQGAVYSLVSSAQDRAIAGIAAGMKGREVDSLARDTIRARGFGEAFGHSLGHGLGLEVHEAPRLAASEERGVPCGSVVTVEPGIYLPGWGGVRLEDDISVGPAGAERLSRGPPELMILG